MTPTWLDLLLAFCGGWLLRVAADPWLRPVPSTDAPSEPPVYLSPACAHEQHGYCLRVCPDSARQAGVCPGFCQCVCHRGQAVEPEAGPVRR